MSCRSVHQHVASRLLSCRPSPSTPIVHASAIFQTALVAAAAAMFVPPSSAQCLVPRELQSIISGDPDAGDAFGSSAAISGTTLVVGAPGDDAFGADGGAVYVFVRAGDSWIQQQKLIASGLSPSNAFGSSVAILGNTILVGAPQVRTGEGAVHVFNRTGTTWTQTIELRASDRTMGDFFGTSVALSSVPNRTVALIGAPGEDNTGPSGTSGGANAGAAYVFTLNTLLVGSVWTEAEKIMATDGGTEDKFGTDVSLGGTTAVVGSPDDNTIEGTDAGSAYVFTSNITASTWTQQTKLSSTALEPGDSFGHAVSYQNNTVVIGAPYTSATGALFRGAFYVFDRVGGVWTEALRYEDTPPRQYFGSSVALAGDSLVVAGFDNTGTSFQAGTARLFQRTNGVWAFRANVTSASTDTFRAYGSAVANSGTVLAVGAYRAMNSTGGRSGAAFPYDVSLADPVVVTQHPNSASSCRGGAVGFDVMSSGTEPITHRWQVESGTTFVDLFDGARVIGDVAGAGTSSLRLTNLTSSSGRRYRCSITNACGTSFSDPASLSLCPADVDDGTFTGVCDGGVTIDDLLYYLTLFADGAIRADLDDGSSTGTPDGGVTIDDLLYYLVRFDAGC